MDVRRICGVITLLCRAYLCVYCPFNPSSKHCGFIFIYLSHLTAQEDGQYRCAIEWSGDDAILPPSLVIKTLRTVIKCLTFRSRELPIRAFSGCKYEIHTVLIIFVVKLFIIELINYILHKKK